MKSLKLSVIAALMFTLGACKSAEEYVEIPAEVMDDKVKVIFTGTRSSGIQRISRPHCLRTTSTASSIS